MELTKEITDKTILQYLKQWDYAKIYYKQYQKTIKKNKHLDVITQNKTARIKKILTAKKGVLSEKKKKKKQIHK